MSLLALSQESRQEKSAFSSCTTKSLLRRNSASASGSKLGKSMLVEIF